MIIDHDQLVTPQNRFQTITDMLGFVFGEDNTTDHYCFSLTVTFVGDSESMNIFLPVADGP